jgi:hypothetical protein
MVVTTCTTRFKMQQVCILAVKCMYFVSYGSKNELIIFLSSRYCLISVMGINYVR